jgi:hypothetical protein
MFSSLVWIINSKYLLKFKHTTKIVWVAVAWTCGFLTFFGSFQLLGVNDTLGFILSLIASIICGAFTSFGNSTIVGFMKAIPAENVLGWSSGTGIAGISGSGTYLLFKTIGLQFDSVPYVDRGVSDPHPGDDSVCGELQADPKAQGPGRQKYRQSYRVGGTERARAEGQKR